MKKIFLLVVAAMMATMSVSAQNGYDTKHEIGINYGSLASNSVVPSCVASLRVALACKVSPWPASATSSNQIR